jgi:hypothetical protein
VEVDKTERNVVQLRRQSETTKYGGVTNILYAVDRRPDVPENNLEHFRS